MKAFNESTEQSCEGAMSTDWRVLQISLALLGGLSLAVPSLVAAAPDKSQEPPLCEDFLRAPDGSWTAGRKVTLNGVTYDAGTAFPTGVTFAGKDWGALLDRKCK
jgi:hypothetical protein